MGNSVYQRVDDTLALYESLTKVDRTKFEFMELYVYVKPDLTSSQIKDVISKVNDKQDEFVFKASAEMTMDGVQVFMNAVRNVLIGFSSISVVVAILMIGIVIYISVIERIDEIGILRSIGARRKDIRNLFLSESMIIGFFAGTIGVLISLGLCGMINAVIASIVRNYGMQLGNVNVAVLDPLVGLMLILVCIVLALIAGLIPSLKAAKMDPIVALRRK
jgi:putative ABC transport system permease protein